MITIDTQNNDKKILGTLVPMSALLSAEYPENKWGTFAEGLIFLDWLKKTHQSAWQLLPLHATQLEPGSTTKHVPSPYKSYGIGLDPKYLSSKYKNVIPTEQEKKEFIEDHHEWIHSYALFCALADHFKTDDWRKWDTEIRMREPKAVTRWKNKLAKQIDDYILIQWQLYESYKELRSKAKKLGIMLVGDLSFYPSINSPLVWTHQKVFQIEDDGSMNKVSGIPDSVRSHFGRQVWGHPLYNWGDNDQREALLSFWQMRLRYQARLFDLIRFDHAKAIFSYGVIDLTNKQADRNEDGPGAQFFEELHHYCSSHSLSIYAEDSGDKLSKLRVCMKKLHIPGIKILRFALDEKREKVNKEYADIAHYPVNTIAYTTTHDTESLLGYINLLTPEQRLVLAKATDVHYDQEVEIFAKRLRDRVLASPAHIVIMPIQDWLLTTERINVPGTELEVDDPNWRFRLKIPIENLSTQF